MHPAFDVGGTLWIHSCHEPLSLMNQPFHPTRRQFLGQISLVAGGAALAGTHSLLSAPVPGGKTPVILTTDIGDDIDDTWALGLLLKSPELDLKLVVGDYGKREYRAKLLAKFLDTAGRSDVPVGMGVDVEPKGDGPQAAWIKDFKLSSYRGRVYEDGIGRMIETIMNSPEPVTLIAIGPMPNVAAALSREPRIATKARLVGMYGSVYRGYDGSKTVSAEWNVKAVRSHARRPSPRPGTSRSLPWTPAAW